MRFIICSVFAGLLFLPLAGHAAWAQTEEAQIELLLENQAAAWNAGDIETFMDGYIESPELRFVSGAGVRKGYRETLERYLKTYDTPEKMGTLAFADLDITILSPEAALAFGHWHLTRPEAGDIGGVFTLVLRHTGHGWRIIHDHTSTAPEGG